MKRDTTNQLALPSAADLQSPIDLTGVTASDARVAIIAQSTSMTPAASGQGWTLPASACHLVYAQRPTEIRALRVHVPALHRLEGRAFAAEVHLVHHDSDGVPTVLAVLAEQGPEDGEGIASVLEARLRPSRLLLRSPTMLAYLGSRTTPPFDAGVTWLVSERPIPISASQLLRLAALPALPGRPLQPRAGRHVARVRAQVVVHSPNLSSAVSNG